MRILFVVPYTPRPIRTRPYYLLRALAARGHAVTLATPWQSVEERACLAEWENLGLRVIAARLPKTRWLWNCVSAIPRSVPLQGVYSWQPELARQIDKLFDKPELPFDVIHIEHLRGSIYGLHLRRRGVPIVYDSVDCISLLFEQTADRSTSVFGRFLSQVDLDRTRSYEPWLAGQFDHVVITSPVDKAALVRLNNSARRPSPVPLEQHITVLRNGVDLTYFCPGTAPRQAASIVFTGRMSYHANISAAVYFARQVMPLVWAERPDTTFTIAGYDPVPEVRLLAREPRIIVTGTVPDVRPYLQQATVAAAPMPYGTGIQNKILEAMACGAPVVTTSQPIAALDAVPGQDLLVGDRPSDLAQHVLTLLNDADLRQRISAAGRRYVEEHHNWSTAVAQLEEIYAAVIAQRRGRPDDG